MMSSMSRRYFGALLILFLGLSIGCTNKRTHNPLANVDSKQPDKVLFDRAEDALKHNRYDAARITLQTLINTYPDSEYIARAKLAVADSWYAEGSSASLAQAEIEYNDFKTFFPNLPEAAEAQLKIANIHYQEMEKPDRDFTHAMRAEEEYRNMILQFPDSKLVPEAKQRLIEVQEVIAEREFRVGHFYFLRQSYPAAIARLRSIEERYPLYSKADETLYTLGQSYEGEISMLRARPGVDEASKGALIQNLTKNATDAYSKIVTRYPLMARADDARAQLEELKQPVPKPTKEDLARNKAEQDSRAKTAMVGQLMRNFQKHPDVASASKVGDPSLTDPPEVSASQVIQEMTRPTPTGSGGGNSVSAEAIAKNGVPDANAPAPRSDSPVSAPADAQPDPNELKPNASPGSNELKPNTVASTADSQLPPPPQINEMDTPQAAATDSAADSSTSNKEDKSVESSSKKKKKKGLHKLNPF